MTHVAEGTLLAIRDGALVDTDDTIHVSGCEVCSSELGRISERAERIGAALRSLDTTIDVERAKASVRARLDRKLAAERPRRRFALPFGRAAAVLLLAAGAASAMPGSPVREWLGFGPSAAVPAETAVPQSAGPTGIEVPVSDQGITIALRGVPVAEEVEVMWIDEPLARISAADGSTYRMADGRAEAVITGGPVSISLPRTGTAVLEINGAVVLTRSGDAVSLPMGSLSSDDDRIVLTVPER